MSDNRRHDRVAGQIRDEIASMIAQGELKDPRIGFTTVTRVELSDDLSHARVLVSVLGSDEEQRETLIGLASATRFLRREVGVRLRLRRAPELLIVLDHGAEQAQRIETLLEQLNREEPSS